MVIAKDSGIAPKRLVILGGGTGGTLAANRLRREFENEELDIVVVDKDNDHIYQPGLLFVPFGLATAEEITRPRDAQLHSGIRFVQSAVDSVDIEKDLVLLADGTRLTYDLLLVASGADLVLDETEGLTGPGWNQAPVGIHSLGDTLEYQVDIPKSGRWDVWVRYATDMRPWGQPGVSGGSGVSVDDDLPLLMLNLPNTGGFDVYRWSKTTTMQLSAGRRRFFWKNL